VTESIGTNIRVSTLGAITAAIQYIRNKNISFTIFIMMALTGAIGAFYGASLIKTVLINFLLILVGLIISYESFILLKENKNNNDKITTQQLLNLNQESKSQNFYYELFL